MPFSGEVYLGHLRYGTFGRNSIEFVHPVMRQNNWKSRTLVLAGNFNLTNTDELYQEADCAWAASQSLYRYGYRS